MNRSRLFSTIPPIVTHLMANLSGQPRVADGPVASQLQILFEDEAAEMACFEIPVRHPPRNVRTMLRMTRRSSSCASDTLSPPRLYNFTQDTRT